MRVYLAEYSTEACERVLRTIAVAREIVLHRKLYLEAVALAESQGTTDHMRDVPADTTTTAHVEYRGQ